MTLSYTIWYLSYRTPFSSTRLLIAIGYEAKCIMPKTSKTATQASLFHPEKERILISPG